jgi:hypothetical protein
MKQTEEEKKLSEAVFKAHVEALRPKRQAIDPIGTACSWNGKVLPALPESK